MVVAALLCLIVAAMDVRASSASGDHSSSSSSNGCGCGAYGVGCEGACNPFLTCNGHGFCDGLGQCVCFPGYGGNHCNVSAFKGLIQMICRHMRKLGHFSIKETAVSFESPPLPLRLLVCEDGVIWLPFSSPLLVAPSASDQWPVTPIMGDDYYDSLNRSAFRAGDPSIMRMWRLRSWMQRHMRSLRLLQRQRILFGRRVLPMRHGICREILQCECTSYSLSLKAHRAQGHGQRAHSGGDQNIKLQG